MTFTTTPFTPNTEGVWLDLPAHVYRSAPGLSQSECKRFLEAATPAHFKAEQAAGLKAATPDMEFGTIVHTAILEHEKLGASYYVRPAGLDLRTKAGKEWRDSHLDRPQLDEETAAKIPKIVAAVNRNPAIRGAIRSGFKEVSFFKRDTSTGLMLKARVDVLAKSQDGQWWIFDLKKVQAGGATPAEFQRSVVNYGYHVQAASYKWITGADHFVFVPFDDSEPFECARFELSYEAETVGFIRWRQAIADYAACEATGIWPGYPQDLQTLSLPGWAMKGQTL